MGVALALFTGVLMTPGQASASSSNDGSVVQEGSRSKAVKATLRTRWGATPLLAEAAEFAAGTSNNEFWTLIDALAGPLPASAAESAAATYKHLMTVAGRSLDGRGRSLLKLALAIRKFSPAVEAQRALLDDLLVSEAAAGAAVPSLRTDVNGLAVPTHPCGDRASGPVFATWQPGEYLCTLDEVRDALKDIGSGSQGAKASGSHSTGPKGVLLVDGLDHVHPASQGDAPVFILYGELGAGEGSWLEDAHKAATFAAKTGKIRYAFRHWWSVGDDDEVIPVGLQGYGVELAIKNMEYRTIDEDTEAANRADGTDGLDGEGTGTFAGQEALDSLTEAMRNGQIEEVAEENWGRLGLQASAAILAAEDPLAMLGDLTGAFPSLASTVARTAVPEKLERELTYNSQIVGLPPGSSHLLLNGRLIEFGELSPYTLMDNLQDELTTLTQLAELGLTQKDIAKLLLSPKRRGSGSGGSEYFNVPRVDIRSEHVSWMNDVKSDERFSRLSLDLTELTTRSQNPYNPLKWVRGNVYNMVWVGHAGSMETLAALAMGASMHQQGAPLRYGYALYSKGPSDEGSHAVALVMNYLADLFEAGDSWSFASSLARQVLSSRGQAFDVTREEVVEALKNVVGPRKAEKIVEDLFNDKEANAAQAKVNAWIESLGLHTGPSVRTIVNGAVYEGHIDERSLIGALLPSMRAIGGAVLDGELSGNDIDKVYDYLLELEDVYPSVSSKVMTDSLEHLDIRPMVGREIEGMANYLGWMYRVVGQAAVSTGEYTNPVYDLTELLILDFTSVEARRGARLALEYIRDHAGASTRLAFVFNHPAEVSASALAGMSKARIALLEYNTVVLAVADTLISSSQHLKMSETRDALDRFFEVTTQGVHTQIEGAVAAFEALQEGQAGGDLGVMGGVGAYGLGDDGAGSFGSVGNGGIDVSSEAAVIAAIEQGKEEIRNWLLDPEKCMLTDGGLVYDTAGNDASSIVRWMDMRAAADAGYGFSPGENGLIVNGRRFAFGAGELDAWSLGEWKLLEKYELTERGGFAAMHENEELDLSEVDRGHTQKPSWHSDLNAKASSILHADYASGVSRWNLPPGLKTEFSSWNGTKGSGFDVIAILDPLSRSAQKAAPLLKLLQAAGLGDVRLILNPAVKFEKMPLQTYYRYVMVPQLEFDEAGNVDESAGAAVFQYLPPGLTLTMGMDVSPAWMIEPVVARHDLDNIRLDSLGEGESVVEAVFDLTALLVTGSAQDVTHDRRAGVTSATAPLYPQGLVLQLDSVSTPHVADTRVLSNLGYFQLKAAPGVRCLDVLEQGHSREVYRLERGRECFAVSSMHGKDFASLPVLKQPGMEGKTVLDLDSADSEARRAKAAAGGGSSWSSWFGDGEKTKDDVDGEKGAGEGKGELETVNVFSVASGHLYERFLKIMMLSVVKGTENPVKFWLIENFLSPGMREFLPSYAEEYGFEYELVTYKWPAWLRAQTEKQRLIWGYKILFLDVLFPDDVKKVVFVDADQVVRADLAELLAVDLQGAPVGMTPFCSSREETSGFAFWRQGYWETHLKGKPYHISALFVVDLERFRAMGAGDVYRSTYHQLSADPGSLSNLDQDLPNYLQHHIPMHSLPLEWLWCETWCDDASKERAKTIDLCNNPLTKTPKLDNAKRILPEWVGLDEEVKRVEREAARDE